MSIPTPHIWIEVILSQHCSFFLLLLPLLLLVHFICIHCWQFGFFIVPKQTSKMQVFARNGWLFLRTMPHDEFTIVHSEFFINTQVERIVYTHQPIYQPFILIVYKKYQMQEKSRWRERERKLQQFLYVFSACFFCLLSVVFFSAMLNGIQIVCAYMCVCVHTVHMCVLVFTCFV